MKEIKKMSIDKKLIDVPEFIREQCGSFSISSPNNVNPDKYILTAEKYREMLIRQVQDSWRYSSN